MNPVLPDEAVEFAAAAAKAFAALGAVDAARRAESRPEVRATEVGAALSALGVDDLDARAGADELAASAALCAEAGRVALPYPVASALLRDREGRPFAVVPTPVPELARARVDHGDLADEWVVATLDGTGLTTAASVGADPLRTRLGPFVTDLALGDAVDADPAAVRRDVRTHLTLSAWQVLGTVERAVELAAEHVTGRIQFGKPLSAFQAVQFQLADASVAAAGLRELAGFTLWRVATAGDAATADVLALRVHAIDVARAAVLRTTQQLHGAAGVCDEYDISVLARHVQPLLRLPCSAEAAAARLVAAIDEHGFDGLFPHGRGAA